MNEKAKYDALAITCGMSANRLFADIIYASRFIRSADDIENHETLEHFRQTLKACRIRIDSMLQTLE